MRRSLLLVIGLALAAAPPAAAGTFAKAPLAPELGLDALTRGVARERVGRDVFADPWATVTISNVDVYDRFPYVESRTFVLVSDPKWNRLVFGEPGRSLAAFAGAGSAFGALSQPHGMAVDERGRVYVADTGNDRVLVFQARTEFDELTLVPLHAIGGLSGPYGVAYSDGGTPYVAGDDWLYVADTGRNRVVAFSLQDAGARRVSEIGDLGSGVGRFAGPMAVATGRGEGGNSADVYVADAHNRRIVRLRNEGGSLQWSGDAPADADVVTSLDTDEWGNLYAAAPQQGVVRKFNPALEPVAELRGAVARPRNFHVPFSNISDHRDGTLRRVGEPGALSIDEWSDASGVERWTLGAGIDGLGVVGGDAPSARFTLTDRAAVTIEITDPADGRVLSRRSLGALGAGVRDVRILPEDLAGLTGPSDLKLRVSATSSYASGATEVAEAGFRATGAGAVLLPTRPMLLGNWPNPAQTSTRISFVLPRTVEGAVSLAVYDAGGRRVRALGSAFGAGLNEVTWDGTDASGRPVRSGVYFYRLDAGGERFTRSMVFAR